MNAHKGQICNKFGSVFYLNFFVIFRSQKKDFLNENTVWQKDETAILF